MTSSGKGGPEATPGLGPVGEAPRGDRGALGCLGWGLVVAGVLVVMAVALVAGAWMALPRLVAPEDPDWEMAAPDADRAEEIREGMDAVVARAADEGRGEIHLSQEDLNVLLAQALDRWHPEGVPPEDRPRLRFLVEEGIVSLEAVGRVPQDARRIPGRLRGELTGLTLVLTPRAAGDAMAMGVDGAYVGRIPLPVGLAMGLLPHVPLDPDVGFLDPARGEIRIPLEPLAGVPELPPGVHLTALEPVDGSLRLEFARGAG